MWNSHTLHFDIFAGLNAATVGSHAVSTTLLSAKWGTWLDRDKSVLLRCGGFNLQGVSWQSYKELDDCAWSAIFEQRLLTLNATGSECGFPSRRVWETSC